jgi:hypothetical protein
MPADDLLRFVGGPLLFSSWWLWVGLILVAAVVVWCAGVVIWTMSPARLRTLPILGALHRRLVRRRFARSIRKTIHHYRSGGLSAAQAGAVVSRTLRSFLYVATGVRAQYLHVREIAAGELTRAGPLLEALNDIQFNRSTRADIGVLGRSAEELIRSWN